MRRHVALLAVALLATAVTPFVSNASGPCYQDAMSCPPPCDLTQCSPYLRLDDCATPLLDAPAGGTAACSTSGGTTLLGNPQGRVLTLATQTGVATAVLTCYAYDGSLVTATLTVPAPFTQSTYVDTSNTYYCYLETSAGFADTTAIAINRTGRPNTITRSSTLSTANCAAAGGLCQRNNPGQPAGNNTDPDINATMVFADDGTTLTGYGVGSGFVPGRSYVSLIYLNPNVATCSRFPAGQSATTTNIANADNDFASMYLGMWSVDDNGFGSFQVFPNKPTPIGGTSLGGFAAYGTVSVRELLGGVYDNQTNPIVNNITAGKDIPPNVFALRACGSLG